MCVGCSLRDPAVACWATQEPTHPPRRKHRFASSFPSTPSSSTGGTIVLFSHHRDRVSGQGGARLTLCPKRERQLTTPRTHPSSPPPFPRPSSPLPPSSASAAPVSTSYKGTDSTPSKRASVKHSGQRIPAPAYKTTENYKFAHTRARVCSTVRIKGVSRQYESIE